MARKKQEPSPFPPLRWDGYRLTGEVRLPSWAGFEVYFEDFDAEGYCGSEDGRADLNVHTPGRERRAEPTPEQAAAFRHLLVNEAAVADAVGAALVRYSNKVDYGLDDDSEVKIPEVSDREHLRPLIGLSDVVILTAARDGVAYVGFGFGCAWDPEHATGVMTHLGRVVAIGQANRSFDERIAEDDKGDPKSGQR